MMRFKNKQMIKYIYNNSLLTINANVLAKSILGIYEKLCVTSCILNLATDLLG